VALSSHSLYYTCLSLSFPAGETLYTLLVSQICTIIKALGFLLVTCPEEKSLPEAFAFYPSVEQLSFTFSLCFCMGEEATYYIKLWLPLLPLTYSAPGTQKPMSD
jgi:hypothetical protein